MLTALGFAVWLILWWAVAGFGWHLGYRTADGEGQSQRAVGRIEWWRDPRIPRRGLGGGLVTTRHLVCRSSFLARAGRAGRLALWSMRHDGHAGGRVIMAKKPRTSKRSDGGVGNNFNRPDSSTGGNYKEGFSKRLSMANNRHEYTQDYRATTGPRQQLAGPTRRGGALYSRSGG